MPFSSESASDEPSHAYPLPTPAVCSKAQQQFGYNNPAVTLPMCTADASGVSRSLKEPSVPRAKLDLPAKPPSIFATG